MTSRRVGCASLALFVALGCTKQVVAPAETAPAPVAPPTANTIVAAEPAEARAAPVPSPREPTATEELTAPPGATRSTTGLASRVLTPGKGAVRPGPADHVRVAYAGWTKDGKMFDASPADAPPTFGVKNLIPGFTEGLELMVEGEKRRLWIPARLAYGDEPKMPGAPAGDLVFDVELLEILRVPDAPSDVAKPPADAQKTKSGLAYKVLKKGTGTTHPTATSQVTVHYSGWTTDGNLFDSSLRRGAPSSFPLDGVIQGWTEGVQLMVEGEKTRFWIPGKLAYGDKPTRPGAPAGMLVFDVELLQIQAEP